jgi:CopG family nickel-responsive transcriptional regulator
MIEDELRRIGIAIPGDLLDKFDELIQKRGYTNRSEAFRDLARAELVQEESEHSDSMVVGTVTLIYNHHVRLLSDKLNSLQHEFHRAILSTLHVHLDHDNCLEVIIIRGKSSDVKQLSGTLIGTKGVKHGRLTIAAAGPDLP